MKLYDLDNVPNSVPSFWKKWSMGEKIAAIVATIAVFGFIIYRLFLRDKEQNKVITEGGQKLTKAEKEKKAYEQLIKKTFGEDVSNQVKDKISKLPDEGEAK